MELTKEIVEALNKIGNFEEEAIEQTKKITYLRNLKVDIQTKITLYSSIAKISIAIDGEEHKNALELMLNDKLNGWCWETCEFISPSFKYDTFICRGYLETYEKDEYYHSWLEIHNKDKSFAFDPCLNILCPKEEYDKIFNTKIIARIPSIKIRDELVKRLNNSLNNKVNINGSNSVDDLFYRADVTINAKISNNKLKKIKVRFYENA